ncbi:MULTISPECIES: hypothetical protein [unclassified Streptomyces]|uniref:hypothetical protein n=1 Tax=unclassified Streptomyces TaxID=2593676 RepID=UPI00331FDE31
MTEPSPHRRGLRLEKPPERLFQQAHFRVRRNAGAGRVHLGSDTRRKARSRPISDLPESGLYLLGGDAVRTDVSITGAGVAASLVPPELLREIGARVFVYTVNKDGERWRIAVAYR